MNLKLELLLNEATIEQLNLLYGELGWNTKYHDLDFQKYSALEELIGQINFLAEKERLLEQTRIEMENIKNLKEISCIRCKHDAYDHSILGNRICCRESCPCLNYMKEEQCSP